MKRGLGKGLDALFADNAADDARTPVTLPLSEIQPNTGQPRKDFDPEALAQLADSIRQHGIIQPLVVRPVVGMDAYQLVAGERRWRAARMAGLSEAPVIIREMDDETVVEVALIENLQREDLNPLEEAEGYRLLQEAYGLTQDQVAAEVGKSRPSVANAMRLLGLPEQVQRLVKSGRLSQGHARTLLALENEEQMLELAQIVMSKGLSVRELERLVRQYQPEKKKKEKTQNVFATQAAQSLEEVFGRKVKVTTGRGKGYLSLEYHGEEDLQELVKRLCGE